MRTKLIILIGYIVFCLFNHETAFAGSVNLLNYLPYDATERNQASCGNCWVWAGTGVMEIARSVHNAGLGISTDISKDRLSIQFLDSCDTDQTNQHFCQGGNVDAFAGFYRQQGFSIPWANTNAYFQDGSFQSGQTSSMVSCNSIGKTPNYPISSVTYNQIQTHNVSQSTAIANIKNVLNQNKAVQMNFYLPNNSDWTTFKQFWNLNSENTIWNPNFSCGHTWGSGGGGHAVIIVGYNDDDPDPNKHYWMVMNSWGIANGNRAHGAYLMAMNINYDCFYPYNTYQSIPAINFFDFSYTFPSVTACTYSISPTSQVFGAASGSGGVNVTTQNGCNWTVSGAPSWVTISGGSGTGNGLVSYNISTNSSTSSRQATFLIAGKSFRLTQEGSSSTLPSNILLNGDFESGSQYWAEDSSGGYDLITNYDQYSHSGGWFAWLGGYDDAAELIYQDVTIPSNATSAYVDFYYQIYTDEADTSTAYDEMAVGIMNPSDNTLLKSLVTLSNIDVTSDWVKSNRLDISEFAGQTIRLIFGAATDSSMPTSFFFDDVTLSVSFPPKSNLAPYQPSGWSDKIVVSNTSGSHTDSNPLYATDNLYLNWAVENNGSLTTPTGFSVALYIDSTLKNTWNCSSLEANYYCHNSSEYNVGSLTSGTHTIKITADSSNSITESNESDNIYTKTITVLTSSYTISGTVHSGNSSGPAISGATISIAGKTATSDTNGAFSISGISAGTYTLTISATGYTSYTNSSYSVSANQSGLNFSLAPNNPPTVTSTSPSNGATGIATTSPITATFSKAMDSSTINTSTFTLNNGATGTVTYNSSTYTATFTPSTALSSNATYTATITTGVKDTNGTALAANKVWTFTTEGIPPTVTSTFPSGNATGVAVATVIKAAFSKAMDASSFTSSTFTLKNGANPVSAAISYDTSKNTVSFTPAAPLLGGATYTATITTGVKDTSGISLAANYSWTFTTIDPVPPTVTSTIPASGSSDIAVTSPVAALFSEAMDSTTITASTFVLKTGSTNVAGTVGYDQATNTATFTPSTILSQNTTYTATITTGVKDLAGNAIAANFSWNFTTGSTAILDEKFTNSAILSGWTVIDNIGSGAVWLFNDPAGRTNLSGGSGGFAIADSDYAGFKDMDTELRTPVLNMANYSTATLEFKTYHKQNGSEIVDVDVSVNGSAGPWTNVWRKTNDYSGAEHIDLSSLAAGKPNVMIRFRYHNANFAWFWQIDDVTVKGSSTIKPTVTSTSPSDGATGVALTGSITATFSKAMDSSTINATTFTLNNGAAGTVSYNSSTNTAIFKPTASLSPNTTYTATITTGAKDSTGNPLAANKTWSFTTITINSPTVTSTSPSDGATEVALTGSITATFSKPMDSSTINATTFTLNNGAAGTVSYNSSTNTAIFKLTASLSPNTTYTATITTGAKDSTGNPLAANKIWSFTTTTLKKNLSVTINGSGSVNSSPQGIACTSKNCTAQFDKNSNVTLMATPGSAALFNGWSGDCTNASGDCVLTMNTDKAVTANFSSPSLVRVNSTQPSYHSSLQAAYDAADNGNIIQAQGVEFSEDFTLDRTIGITFKGGYDSGYGSLIGTPSILNGKLTIQNGSVIVDKLTIR